MSHLAKVLFLLAAMFGGASAAERPRLLVQRIAPTVSALYIANADGSGERKIFGGSDLDYNASLSPDGKWVLFTSERAGSADIYRARVDGSGVERLTDNPAYDDQAAWSPDGKAIAFVSSRGSGVTDVWTLDLGTHRLRNVTAAPGGDFRPSWSPDGRWIAFSSDRETHVERRAPEWEQSQRTSLYLIHPDGSGLRRLTDGEKFAGSPRWSPDGKRIVFYELAVADTHAAREGGWDAAVPSQIVSIEVASGARLELTSGRGLKISPQFLDDQRVGYVVKAGPEAGLAFTSGERGERGAMRNPRWSADGRQVVYDRGAVESVGGYQPLQPLPGGGGRFNLVHFGRLAAFSPDGRRLAFSEPAGGPTWAISVMDADGRNPKRVYFEKGAAAMAPRWSPDGRQLVFGVSGDFSSRGISGRIVEMNADGSNLRVLTTGAGAGFPSFSPDGGRLVFRVWGKAEDERGLRILTLATGAVTRLTGSDYDTFPGWSPRGDLIAFTSWRNDDFDIYTIRPDGTGLKRLTTTPGNDAHSSWSPDGKWLMFASSRLGFKDEAPLSDDQSQPYGEIFVMRADGSEQRAITDNQWEDGPGAWPPVAAKVHAAH
jgi:TolB protein